LTFLIFLNFQSWLPEQWSQLEYLTFLKFFDFSDFFAFPELAAKAMVAD